MSTLDLIRPTILAVLTLACSLPSTQAADINGAWASDASVCGQVFEKTKDKISLRPNAELYGGGLLLEGNRATGAFQKCTVKSMKHDGAKLHVIASCSTGVMVSDQQVTVNVIGENQITLSPAGPIEMTIPYVRCQL